MRGDKASTSLLEIEPGRGSHAGEMQGAGMQGHQMTAQMEMQPREIPLAVMPPYSVEMQARVLGLVLEAREYPDVHLAGTPRAVP